MTEIKPLGKIVKLLEDIGYNVTYAYEDLVFIEHSHFLIKMDLVDNKKLHFYYHNTIDKREKEKLFKTVATKFLLDSFTMVESGTFEIKESNDQENNIDILFYENK
jgi:hypothetical protein